MNQTTLTLKIDVDTERGTRVGVPQLAQVLKELNIPATFFFSLGPDNTGRAIKRIFRRGFLSKASRTSVVNVYGIRTLLNGVLLPGPHIGKRHATIMREIKSQGFSVGIHCHDHIRWQDGVTKISGQEIAAEFLKARDEYEKVFGEPAKSAAAPGWQANEKTLAVYDAANLTYASDCRGREPFFPRIGSKIFQTLQIPTTLPTLDELLGLPDFPLMRLINYYSSLLTPEHPNVLTIHAELEGMKYLHWFKEFLLVLKQQKVEFAELPSIAERYLANRQNIPVCDLIQGEIPGRSGKLACQIDLI